MDTLIKSEDQVTAELVNYIYDEAKELSDKSSELEIENYMDRELLNPLMAAFLEQSEVKSAFFDEADPAVEPLVLTAYQYHMVSTKANRKGKFRRLKRKVRKIFCEITRGLEDLDTKELIKKVLLALIPGLTGGIPGIIFPLIIGIVAYFLKKGYEATCPL